MFWKKVLKTLTFYRITTTSFNHAMKRFYQTSLSGIRKCKYNWQFTSVVTQNTYEINYELNCNDKFLLYLLIYKQSFKQYLEEATDVFNGRWNNYKYNARKFLREESCMQHDLFENFQRPGKTSFAEDKFCCKNFVDKIDLFISTKSENYWRQGFKILAPHCLNIKESV